MAHSQPPKKSKDASLTIDDVAKLYKLTDDDVKRESAKMRKRVHTVDRAELAKLVSQISGHPKHVCRSVIKALAETLVECMIAGIDVELRPFGRFWMRLVRGYIVKHFGGFPKEVVAKAPHFQFVDGIAMQTQVRFTPEPALKGHIRKGAWFRFMRAYCFVEGRRTNTIIDPKTLRWRELPEHLDEEDLLERQKRANAGYGNLKKRREKKAEYIARDILAQKKIDKLAKKDPEYQKAFGGNPKMTNDVEKAERRLLVARARERARNAQYEQNKADRAKTKAKKEAQQG